MQSKRMHAPLEEYIEHVYLKRTPSHGCIPRCIPVHAFPDGFAFPDAFASRMLNIKAHSLAPECAPEVFVNRFLIEAHINHFKYWRYTLDYIDS